MPDPASPTISELEEKMADILARIAKEQKIIDGSKAIRLATRNADVLRQTDAKERDAKKSLEYFHATLADLQAKRDQLAGVPAGPSRQPYRGDPNSYRNDHERPLPAPPHDGLGGPNARTRPYNNLELIQADTPHTPAKIQKMLNQLEFKLQVERQYQKGFDLMQRAYTADGDKKSRQDAQNQKMESDRTILLLSTALKRYKDLHVIEVAEEEDAAEPTNPSNPIGDRKGNLRKPLTGTLQITVKAAKELEHALLPKKSSKVFNETTIVLKIEGNARAKSHPSRTDHWNQDFELSVDKANELTIAIYDKHGNEMPAPIGFTWIRLSDVVDALRKQKIGMEAAGGGWVTADGAMNNPGGYGGQGRFEANPYQLGGDGPLMPGGPGGGMGMGGGGSTEGIEAWFIVEPAGAILLQLNFIKENVRKRPLDAGLARQVAVRKRKEVHEMNGHKFVPQQFYQIMLCAFCEEFLLNATGYQCEDCRYTCHKKCYEKVVTKCISKSNTGTEGDEEKIKHRIPHRFETITNLGANWCCHCGYMLPLGRKNAKKCSECGVTCHSTCMHFVPDFCGMRMETANRLLADMKLIKSTQSSKRPSTIKSVTQPGRSSTGPGYEGGYHSPERQQQPLGMGGPGGQLDLTGGYPNQAHGGGYQSPSGPGSPPRQQTQTPQSAYGGDLRYTQPAPLPPTAGSPQQQYPGSPPGMPGPPPRPPPPPGHQQRMSGSGSVHDQNAYPGGPAGRGAGYDPMLAGYQSRPQQLVPLRRDDYPAGQPVPHLYAEPGRGSMGGRPGQQHPDQYPSRQGSMPQNKPQQQTRKARKVGLDDFNFLAVLGKGNFGKVMLAEEKRTSDLYAIKVLKKEFIIDNDEVESTRSEKRVFLAAARERHPFLLNLHSCFQTETRVYFVMEYVSGGDLMLHIQRKQFSLRQAKFYASEVLLALEYFHANGIIYRDLKLDNILLTLDGHVKVADYGLCKEDMQYGKTTSTFCGTPEFMAPEILLEQRYGCAVDWWAFGVLTYEMLLGQSPFRGDDEDEIFDAILEDEPLYPITMPKDAVSILQKLLTRDPARRLGAGPEDAVEIKRHPFFKDVNWDDVFHKRIPPPYFPQIKAPGDVSNFDTEFTKEQPTLTPVHGQLTAKDQQEFNGFLLEPFTSISRQVLRVYNHGSQPVAFKVKTTAPKLYCVRPNSGKVDPGSSVEVSVLLQPMKEDPPLNVKCKDKFLVQSTVVPHGIEANDVWGLAATDKSLEVHQQKLKVAYLPAEGALQEEDEPEMHQLSMMSEADSHRYETVRQAPNGTGPTEGAPIPVFENEHDTAHHRPHTPDHAEFSNAHEEHEILPTAAPIPVAAPTANSTVTAPTAPSAIIATPPRTTAQAEYDPNYALKLAEANAEIARLQALLARNNDQTLKRRTIFSDDGTSVQDGITEIGDDSASVIGGGSVIGARSEGVPLNVVAILSLLVFVVTYLFF